ncbi:unnamed protein product [Arabis nemorensis]|uniref:PHD-type domain-containing protein n=1 Tax=Arabis nemorensis TaxID=586526 RepID=A0A565B7R4_9BRAS|nr:unnamed protein product [Arabis nemorensis]
MCVVCQSTDGDPLNPIVFCDGCDLMVHASCHGNPLVKAIPEGDWFCELCIGSKKNREKKLFSCCLCTTKSGAMKPTKDGLQGGNSLERRKLIRNLIAFSVFFEIIAVVYAIMTIRNEDLDWKLRSFRILPMFLLPALASLAYSSIVTAEIKTPWKSFKQNCWERSMS